MTSHEFQELTGEDPEDMFGPDWENEVIRLGILTKDGEELA